MPEEDTQADLRPKGKGTGNLTKQELDRLRRPGRLPSSLFIRSTPASESEPEEPVKQLPRPEPEPKKPRPKPKPKPKSAPKTVKQILSEPADLEELNRRGRQECIRVLKDLVRAQMEVVRKEQNALRRYEMALDIYVHGLPQGGEPVSKEQEGK